MDAEPFVGPTRTEDLMLVGLAGLDCVTWIVWSAALVIGIGRQWVRLRWLSLMFLPCIAGGISLLVVYLYGFDQRWFR